MAGSLPPTELFHPGDAHAVGQQFLAGIAAVEAAHADAGAAGDLGDGGVPAALGEDLARGLEEAGVVAVRLPLPASGSACGTASAPWPAPRPVDASATGAPTALVVLLGAAGFTNNPIVVGEVVRIAGAGRSLSLTDGGCPGTGLVIPHRRPRGGELNEWPAEHNRAH